jgi:hypothetical protein
MADAFGTVMLVVVILSLISATWAFIGTGDALRQIGRGGLSLNDGHDRPMSTPAPTSAAGRAERETEIRQMLEARNIRRAARGLPPRDVERQLAELIRPTVRPLVDPGLEAEVRELVIARNARRLRAGRPALDVEEEIAKALAEAGSLP